MRMSPLFLSIIFGIQLFSSVNLIFADEWKLEDTTPKLEWGLEKQTVTHKKSDSVVLHYDGIHWSRQRSGTDNWLRRILAIDSNTIFAIGDNGTILYYDGKKWNKQKSGTDYLLLRTWGNKKDDVYVVGINPKK